MDVGKTQWCLVIQIDVTNVYISHECAQCVWKSYGASIVRIRQDGG